MRVRTVELADDYVDGAKHVVASCLAPGDAADWKAARPPLTLVAVTDADDVVGVAFGRPASEGGVHLQGIGVLEQHRRSGLGSHLLAAFERAARSIGAAHVSLGSWEEADAFYLAAGYLPVGYLATLSAPLDVCVADLPVERIRVDGDRLWLNITNGDGYDPAARDLLAERLAATGVSYIFAKRLGAK